MVCVYDSVHRDAGWVILEYMWELYNIEHIALSICPTSKGSEILISSVPIFQGLLPPARRIEDHIKTLSKQSPYSITQLKSTNFKLSSTHCVVSLM